MIKLVQGFDIISPLPIDGRILLSSGEMKEIADYLLPDKYFAICRDDGKLYIYDKSNVVTDDPKLGYGRFRKANNDANSYTDQKAEELDSLILGQNRDVDIPDPDLDQGVYGTLWNKITNESVTWATNLRAETSTRIQKDDELSAKIDNYKVNQNLINTSDLETELLDYSTVDNTARYIKAYVDSNYRLILQLEDSNHRIISTDNSVDLPLENLVVDIDYVEDSQGKALLITLQGEDSEGNHRVLRVPLDAMIAGLVSEPMFNAHVDDLDAHLRDGERTKWNNIAENAITSSNLSEHIVSGNNTTVSKVTGTNNVKIDAVDTTYVAGEGIGIYPVTGSPYTYRITTEASAPGWASINGNDPRENESLDNLFDSIETSISSKQNEITSSNKLDADLVDDTSTTNKFITSDERLAWNAKQNAITSEAPLSSSLVDDTLSASHKFVTPEEKLAWNGKQDAITNSNKLSYTLLSDTPTIGNGTLTIDVALAAPEAVSSNNTFTANQAGDKSISIKVPNKTSHLTNDSDFQNSTQVSDTISSHNTSTAAHSDIRTLISSSADNISAIEDKIPSQASSSNQLADKEYVNSSISTSTATFRGTVTASEDTDSAAQTALSSITGMDDNDYAFVSCLDSAGNTKYKKYKYTGSSWAYEYTLNNSSFTSSQWGSINSGITSTMVGSIPSEASSSNKLITSSNFINELNTKQAVLIGSGEGQNIKTVNGTDLVGSGNVSVGTVTSIGVSTTSPITTSNSSAITGSGTITIGHATSGVTAGSYGQDANATISSGGTFTVPYVTVNSTGHITDSSNKTITMFGVNTEKGLTSGTNIGIRSFSFTISSGGWTAAAGTAGQVGYYKDVTVNNLGITSNSTPILCVDMGNVTSANDITSLNEAWSKIYRFTTSNNSIRFYSTESISVAIPVKAVL